MSTKKEETAQAETAAEETKQAAVEQDPWKIMKEVFLPKGGVNEQKSEFACVNGRSYTIPKGKTVQVPLPIWEAIRNARLQQEAAEEAAERLQQGAM